jgi:hypothetical protein
VLDDGHHPVGLLAEQLEHDTYGAKRSFTTLPGLHDGERRRLDS